MTPFAESPFPGMMQRAFFVETFRLECIWFNVQNKQQQEDNMSKELAKTYDPKGIEDRIYEN